jgi:hypothetical protein
MPRADRERETSAWGYDTSTLTALALAAVGAVALVAGLFWPQQFARGFTGYLIGMLFAAVGIDGIFELVGGFIRGGRGRYIRGAVLLAEALLFAILTR